MAWEGSITGPNPVTLGVTAFRYVTGIEDDSRIESRQIAAARDAGYTGSRDQLIAIGQGLTTPAFGMQSQDRDQLNVGPRTTVTVTPTVPLPGAAAPQPIPSPKAPGSVLDDLLRGPVRGGGGTVLDDLLRRPVGGGFPPQPGTVLDELLRRPVGSGIPGPDTSRMPRPLPPIGAAAAALILGVLWPSPIKADPPWQPPPPKIPTAASGPKRRGRARRMPRGLLPQPVRPPPSPPTGRVVTRTPRMPAVMPEIRPDIGPISLPAPRPVPTASGPMPSTSPVPAPRPMPAPSVRSFPWPSVLPWLMPSPRATTGRNVAPGRSPVQLPVPIAPPQLIGAPNSAGLTRFDVRRVPSTLTSPFGEPPRDDCRCSSSKRKPRKKSCTNPIVSKRKRTKDGRVLLTTTRELKCPA